MVVVLNPSRAMKDPSALTAYENKILDLKNKGLDFKQIVEELGGKCSRSTIASRYQIIKEKLAIQESQNDG